jgi:hypothetical protein
MLLLYSVSIRLYALGVSVAALFNRKARLWRAGRKHWRENLKQNIPAGRQPIWFHCASLGEFEQGRPIMESIRETFPDAFFPDFVARRGKEGNQEKGVGRRFTDRFHDGASLFKFAQRGAVEPDWLLSGGDVLF